MEKTSLAGLTRAGGLLIALAVIVWSATADPQPDVAIHRRMAITVDDLPQNSRIRTPEHRSAINRHLLKTIKAEGIPAVGFVNASKCYEDGNLLTHQVDILQEWIDAGLELGNHTWSHPDYRGMELEEFAHDIERGEPLLNELMGEVEGRTLRWFRHPFLFRGNTDEKREALETYLRNRGYDEAPVSMDNGEWIYAAAYDRAILDGDEELKARIGEDYVRYMMETVHFWESQSQQLFDRNIDHVLLIHENTINADHLHELVSRLRRLGYEFITLDEAVRDPAYQSEDRYTGRAGISWIHRWAITRDVDRSMFADEPQVPDWIEGVYQN